MAKKFPQRRHIGFRAYVIVLPLKRSPVQCIELGDDVANFSSLTGSGTLGLWRAKCAVKLFLSGSG